MRLTLNTFLTLDGVMQAPGQPGEDTRGGFEHGGWQFPHFDDDAGRVAADWFAEADAFLLGRRTYEIFAGYWPKVTDESNVFALRLNTLPKYVVSTTLSSADWQNTTLISEDVVGSVTRLKAQPGNELQVHGSGRLAATLEAHDLIDEYRLWFHPVILGTGHRLFTGAGPLGLRLTGVRTTGSGVIIASYEPTGAPRHGSFAEE